jgi:PAS domain S-box-containing protein
VDPAQRAGVIHRLHQGESVRNLECLQRTKSGRVVVIEASFERIQIGSQACILAMNADITDRKKAERQRALEHAVNKVLAGAPSLADATPDLLMALCRAEDWDYAELWGIDPIREKLSCLENWNEAHPRFEALNASARRLRLGRTECLPGQVWELGRTVAFPSLEDEPAFLRKDEAKAAGLRSAIAFPIQAGGKTTGVMVFMGAHRAPGDAAQLEMLETIGTLVGQYIARKQAQEELKRFVALSPSVIYALRIIADRPRAYWVSENLLNLTGYRPEEVVRGSWWADHIHPEDRQRVLAANGPPFETEHRVMEFRFRHRNGEHFWLRDEQRLLRDSTGRAVEIIGVWTNVTDRMRLESQLLQAQKMEAIGQLSGGIAHDFNNILGAITGNAQIGAMELPADHPAAGCLAEILKASDRAASLVRQILTFARQNSQEKRVIELQPIVQESVRLLRATIPAGVDLSLSIPERVPPVLADETQIQQVVLNLGTNAWHALTDGSGNIQISLEPVNAGDELVERIPGLNRGLHARLRVRDTGKGIDPGTLERIFEPFFTTKEVGKGTGLGLAVVHGIVRSHSGTVHVDSIPGEGSTFDIYLPAVESRAALAPVPPAVLRAGNGERLMLVDDDPTVLRTTTRVLEILGYQVTAFADPTRALEAFAAGPQAWELVLTDLNMPGLSGLDLAHHCLERRPDLPILLCSGVVTEELRATAERSGIRQTLRKPSSLEQIGEAIRHGLQSAQGTAGRSS